MTPRVLILADTPYIGGITSYVIAAAEALREKGGAEAVLATLPGRRDDATLMEQARARGLEVHTFAMRHRFDLAARGPIRDFARAERIDLIHTHDYRAHWLLHNAPGLPPVVSTCHGIVTSGPLRTRLWQRGALHAMRGHRRVIAVSEAVRRELLARGLDPARVKTVYSGYSRPEGVTPADRGALGIPDGRLVVLYCGRLVEEKGVRYLIEAMEGLVDVALLIAGTGPAEGALKTAARNAFVAAVFTGAVTQPAPLYALADVVALPSASEALPMTLVEAAAWGKPALATRVGGTPEVVEDGATGMLMAHSDVSALRDALCALRDPALRARLGAAARARWQERFSPERFGEGLAEVYREALE